MCAKVVMLGDIRDTQRSACDALWGHTAPITGARVVWGLSPLCQWQQPPVSLRTFFPSDSLHSAF